jgi:hypothetical protein
MNFEADLERIYKCQELVLYWGIELTHSTVTPRRLTLAQTQVKATNTLSTFDGEKDDLRRNSETHGHDACADSRGHK